MPYWYRILVNSTDRVISIDMPLAWCISKKMQREGAGNRAQEGAHRKATFLLEFGPSDHVNMT